MQINEKYARLRFSLNNKIHFSHYLEVLEKFGSIENFFKSTKYADFNVHNRENINILDEITENEFVVYGEDAYPVLLNSIPSPPIALFYKGDLSLASSKHMISIVGTRSQSQYATRVTHKIIKLLSQFDYTFVSGMANGIDTLVHKFSLQNDAKTIAILPSSIDNPVPKSNFKLFGEIAEKGLVISENLNNNSWNKSVYAKRNRIIAGISDTTLVIEAPKKSGALITANLAFEYNRNLFAVPGNIDSKYSEGTNNLIKCLKAQLYSDIGDIIPQQSKLFHEKNIFESKLESELYEILKVEPLSDDQIASIIKIDNVKTKRLLLEMEMKGVICLNEQGKYNIKLF